jgi:hypothetical protein
MAGEVRLVDLDVIKRYSLAVRQEWAPADELLASLEATREAVLAALGRDGGAVDADAAPPRKPRRRA